MTKPNKPELFQSTPQTTCFTLGDVSVVITMPAGVSEEELWSLRANQHKALANWFFSRSPAAEKLAKTIGTKIRSGLNMI